MEDDSVEEDADEKNVDEMRTELPPPPQSKLHAMTTEKSVLWFMKALKLHRVGFYDADTHSHEDEPQVIMESSSAAAERAARHR